MAFDQFFPKCDEKYLKKIYVCKDLCFSVLLKIEPLVYVNFKGVFESKIVFFIITCIYI